MELKTLRVCICGVYNCGRMAVGNTPFDLLGMGGAGRLTENPRCCEMVLTYVVVALGSRGRIASPLLFFYNPDF